MTFKDRFAAGNYFVAPAIEIMSRFSAQPFEAFRIATREEDCREATDVVVNGKRIGIRKRNYRYLANNFFEATFRDEPIDGLTTEYEKVFLHSYCDYWFTCFADPTDSAIADWHFIDLNRLRLPYQSNPLKTPPLRIVPNSGEEAFRYLQLDRCCPSAIVRSSRRIASAA
jgi:hypothetical protein